MTLVERLVVVPHVHRVAETRAQFTHVLHTANMRQASVELNAFDRFNTLYTPVTDPYRVRQKVAPVGFADFSETAWNCKKTFFFYIFI